MSVNAEYLVHNLVVGFVCILMEAHNDVDVAVCHLGQVVNQGVGIVVRESWKKVSEFYVERYGADAEVRPLGESTFCYSIDL